MTADIPLSTYRLQLNKRLNFSEVRRLISYFHDLGITHLYLSPCLRTRQGSTHGYATSDFNSINPDIGSPGELRSLSQSLKQQKMGVILDFVPNHMSIFNNAWWTDVLENGHSSAYAGFFDIDWDPVKDELKNKVLLPILEDFYGNVLDRGLLKLVFDKGAFYIKYHEHALPLDPGTYPVILNHVLENLQAEFSQEDRGLIELQSIMAACKNLPLRTESGTELVAERQREKEVIKRRLKNLQSESYSLRRELNDSLSRINGESGDPLSHDRLHEIIEQQAYRLSYWLVAADEINYRRFFDINELIALNMERDDVFAASHRLVFELLSGGIIDGMRIDHVDGLFDPAAYLHRLQNGYLAAIELGMAANDSNDKGEKSWMQQFVDLLLSVKDSQAEHIHGEAGGPLYLIVEKILCPRESLRPDWPINGTTGYEFSDALNGIFINRRHTAAIMGTYRMLLDSGINFHDVVYRSKNLVLKTSMAAELNLLAHQINRLSEKSRYHRDFTLNSIRDALQTIMACFPVYRTYIKPDSDEIDEADRAAINQAIAAAKKRNVAMNTPVIDFIGDSLLLKFPPDMDASGREAQRSFVLHFQQLTGPVMAKGLEDTAFYIFVPLLSLNEVGGNPLKFGHTVQEFHAQNLQRASTFPDSMISTSTHDSKRSEDVRARLNVLTELPHMWRSSIKKWVSLNKGKKSLLDGAYAPDPNEEYYIYQVLAGSYPLLMKDKNAHETYANRVKENVVKALREAKIHSSWISPDTAYEEACRHFVENLLDPSPDNLFLADFRELHRITSTCGMYNSLSQTLLKIFSPGVPDIYRGNEAWIFDLTDPDNRRPVNFLRRRQMLNSMKKQISLEDGKTSLCNDLTGSMKDGRIKLYVTWQSLIYRREHHEMFSSNTYVPLYTEGDRKNSACAFLRRDPGSGVIVIAPLQPASLTSNGLEQPLGEKTWGNTFINLPRACAGKVFHNIFTGENIDTGSSEGPAILKLSEVFNIFPVAALHFSND